MTALGRRLLARTGPAALLVTLAVLPYLPALRGGFVWDDSMLITEDARFHDEHPVLELFTGDFFGHSEEIFRYGYYRPLVSLSDYLTWRAVDGRPLAYHLQNVVLHGLVTLEVWWLLGFLVPGSRWPPWVGAALFAVHPVHVETVAWISGRTDLLCAVFLLPFLGLAWSAARGEGVRPVAFAGGTVLYAGAIFSKEMAALAVPALLLLALLDGARRRRWLAWAGVATAVTVVFLAVRHWIAHVHVPVTWAPSQLPEVLWTLPATFLRYLGKLVLPWRAEPFMVNPLRPSPLAPFVVAGTLAAAGLVWWAWRRRGRPDGVLMLFFLAAFAPISNLVRITGPVSMGAPMAERFLYIPSVFFCGLVALGLVRLAEKNRALRTIGIAAVILVLAAGSAAVWHRAPLWGDEERLFATMVAQAPNATLPHTLLGTLRRRQGRFQEGERELRRALELAGGPEGQESLTILNNLAGCVAAQGRLEEADRLLDRASDQLTGELVTSSAAASVEANRGLVALGQGRPREAERHLRAALAADPSQRQALFLLGRLLAASKPQEAERLLERYRRRWGDTPEVLTALADAVGRQGRRDEARELLRRAASLAPGRPEIELPLGALELSEGRTAEAERAFLRVLEKDPRNVRALAGAGIAAARTDRFGRARSLLERALAIAPDDPEVLLDLALVEGALGDTGRARALASRARAAAPAGGPLARRAAALERELGDGGGG